MDCSIYINMLAGSTIFRTLLLGETPVRKAARAYARAILDAIEAERRRRE